MKYIPNLITSLNLASGFTAILLASQGNLNAASWLIIAAMIFDFLDGFSARLLKAYSDIGKELDSLADIVSFGVAPAIILFRLIHSAAGSPAVPGTTISNIMILSVTVIMPVCAALRLAVFNLDSSQTTTFKGLPTPANAIAVISIILAINYSGSAILNSFTGSPLSLSLYSVLLSILMVSRVELLSLKIKSFSFKGNEGRYILLVLLMISAAIFGIMTLPLIIPLYIIASVAGKFAGNRSL